MTASHQDHQLFQKMTDILVSSSAGDADYGLDVCMSGSYKHGTRYEDLAVVMNRQGFRNRYGKPLSGDALRKMTRRMKESQALDEIKPDFFDCSSNRVMPGDCPSNQPLTHYQYFMGVK